MEGVLPIHYILDIYMLAPQNRRYPILQLDNGGIPIPKKI